MNKILVSPSILSADFSKLDLESLSLQQCGADWVHCDVMDGKFVNNTTFNHETVAKIRQAVQIIVDAHLMIETPELFVDDYIKAGADVITFHLEACQDTASLIKYIKDKGVKCGLSIKPNTPVESLYPYLDDLDMVLIMSVEPGWGGQKFLPSALPKLETLRKRCPDLLLQVDGGINLENVQSVIDAGANCIVSGSTVFKSDDRKAIISALRGK
ncbi:MAG: ribulose-phosphate 3-epimerase [Clostridia bacterium]|nr:ribulose-phosphate 3-epimerase [Clostridia bacterium]